jgi:hypothetical protein
MSPSKLPFLLAFTALALVVSCGGEAVREADSPALVDRGPPIVFSYPTVDGSVLSSDALLGRYTVLGFVATYDEHSHAQALFLTRVVRHHVPRINAGVIVLEPEANRVLIEAFKSVVDPPYPVAIADEATIAGVGPFQELHHVPSIVILDPQGRLAWRHLGIAGNDVIDAALRALEKGKTPPP